MRDEDAERARRRHARQAMAAQIDREDLLTILAMRFGVVPVEVRERIKACDDLEALERLILVAANVPAWRVFLEELGGRGDEFKVTGARYDPLAASPPMRTRTADAPQPDTPRPMTRLIQIRRPKGSSQGAASNDDQ